MGQAESRQEQFWEACGFGHTEKVKEFINTGIDVNWVSKTHDSSPIHVASQGKPKIVQLLVNAGCDVNARDERQCTALHHAAMNGYKDCAEILIKAGAVINVQDKNRWTPLHCAAYWAHPEVTELLLANKADANIQNKDDRFPIHEVARSKNKDEQLVGRTAHLLLDAGSDVESKVGTDGFSDFTVLMFASYHGHISIVRHLVDAMCEVNAQSSNKWTALHWAADRGHSNVVELLLDCGADVSLLGERSETARDRARSDDVRAVFDRYSCLNKSSEKANSDTSRSKHRDLDENDLPDIHEFPSHLQEPESGDLKDLSNHDQPLNSACDSNNSSPKYGMVVTSEPQAVQVDNCDQLSTRAVDCLKLEEKLIDDSNTSQQDLVDEELDKEQGVNDAIETGKYCEGSLKQHNDNMNAAGESVESKCSPVGIREDCNKLYNTEISVNQSHSSHHNETEDNSTTDRDERDGMADFTVTVPTLGAEANQMSSEGVSVIVNSSQDDNVQSNSGENSNQEKYCDTIEKCPSEHKGDNDDNNVDNVVTYDVSSSIKIDLN